MRALLILSTSLCLCSCSIFRGVPMQVEHAEGVTPTGVRWRDTLGGLGPVAQADSRVTIHYTAKLEDGGKIDSSHDRGEPVEFRMSAAPVLGWADAIPGMRAGGKRWLRVPPHRAFGDEGIEGLIPPRAMLEFLIELLEVHGD